MNLVSKTPLHTHTYPSSIHYFLYLATESRRHAFPFHRRIPIHPIPSCFVRMHDSTQWPSTMILLHPSPGIPPHRPRTPSHPVPFHNKASSSPGRPLRTVASGILARKRTTRVARDLACWRRRLPWSTRTHFRLRVVHARAEFDHQGAFVFCKQQKI